jgi:hypothetical protein
MLILSSYNDVIYKPEVIVIFTIYIVKDYFFTIYIYR